MSRSDAPRDQGTLDTREVERFDALAADWWDPEGDFRALHRLNPTRLAYVRDQLCRHFARDPATPPCLEGLSLIDIGCGGGLLCEPLARLGAEVTGLDPSPLAIAAACRHAEAQGLAIAYRAGRAEALAAEGVLHDGVLVMEVIEHVPDVPAFLRACGRLVRPGGMLLLSTINRTIKSFALAIVGAEYVLRWLPVGTHRWDRFVTPEELRPALASAGLALEDVRGLVYSPFRDAWRLADDTDVNYLAAAVKRAPRAG